MHSVVRLAASELHPFEVAFFRNLFGLLVLLPFFFRHGLKVLATARLPEHLLRGVLQVLAMLMFFTALTLAPLAEVTALAFTAPLFATMGAVLLLGEKIRARRLSALLIGYAGTLVVLRPGFHSMHRGSLLVLASSALWALCMLVIKRLSRTDSSATLTAYMGFVLTPLSFLAALTVWTWPHPRTWFWLVLLGVVGASSQYLMAESFRLADASAVLPADFTRMLWASLFGYFIFHEVPEVWTYVGAGMICASTLYIAYREARLAPVPAVVTRVAASE